MMSFQSRNSRGQKKVAPAGYVPGLGRGALGFTTRSDVGPMSSKATPDGGDGTAEGSGVSGSRSAELRAMKLSQKKAAVTATSAASVSRFGVAPQGYIPGAGRGAGMGGGGGGDNDNVAGGAGLVPTGSYDAFSGYDHQYQDADEQEQYDQDDDEADQIWAAIDERMNNRRRKRKRGDGAVGGGDDDDVDNNSHNDDETSSARTKIGVQFRELKEKLANVTEDEWSNIPDVGDYSLKYKQKQRNQNEMFTPIADSLLDQRNKLNTDATAGGNTRIAATTAISGMDTTTSTAINTTNMSGVGVARGTVLGMSLDKMSDSVSGQTVVDPQGYLTSLSNTKIATNAEVSDINKARLLLKSVRETNPKHGPGWIASARVEEAAGKILQARKIIQEACRVIDNRGPSAEDVWLEAARLHPQDVAKTILATAVRRIPTSVKCFLRAAELEHNEKAKKAVLRKALEANPTSVTLWKAAIELEEANDARILLSVAVEKVPHCVEMWLALARLETYTNAQKVLNKARKALPAERAIWIAAAKLEESQQQLQQQTATKTENDDTTPAPTVSAIIHNNENDTNGNANPNIIEKLIDRAVRSLSRHDAIVTRAQWLQEAENAESSAAPLTSAAIIKHTIGKDVDIEDRQRTWADDAKSVLSRGSVATARAILAHALSFFPNKRSLWMQTVDLERKYGSAVTLDEVLAAASERLPRAEIFWLLRAKERWMAGDIDKAREILTGAFAANPDSEQVWLAAAKLEWETDEIDRAQILLERARERASTPRVYMKSALLEREQALSEREQHNLEKEQQNLLAAIELIEEGLQKYPTFPKLYMMGGQICSNDLQPLKLIRNLNKARIFYQRGLQQCPNNIVLWTLASRLEENASTYHDDPSKNSTNNNGNNSSNSGGGITKARGLLEIARLKNPKNPRLWLESIRLERRRGAGDTTATSTNNNSTSNNNNSEKLARDLMSRALQECPNSGILLAENIITSPRVEQKSKAADAIKRCPEDPIVICSVASLFVLEKKHEKARKWFDRAVILDPTIGDTWVKYYVFECQLSTNGDKDTSKNSNNDNASNGNGKTNVKVENDHKKTTTTTPKAEKVKERCIAAEPRYGELWTSVRKDMSNRRKSIAVVLELAAKKVMNGSSAMDYL